MNNNYLKILIISVWFSGLLGVVACATSGGYVSPGPATPGASPGTPAPSPGYGPAPPEGDFPKPFSPTPSDPEFWKMWESSRGIG